MIQALNLGGKPRDRVCERALFSGARARRRALLVSDHHILLLSLEAPRDHELRQPFHSTAGASLPDAAAACALHRCGGGQREST